MGAQSHHNPGKSRQKKEKQLVTWQHSRSNIRNTSTVLNKGNHSRGLVRPSAAAVMATQTNWGGVARTYLFFGKITRRKIREKKPRTWIWLSVPRIVPWTCSEGWNCICIFMYVSVLVGQQVSFLAKRSINGALQSVWLGTRVHRGAPGSISKGNSNQREGRLLFTFHCGIQWHSDRV